MNDVWKDYSKSYITLEGHKVAMVRTKPTPKGEYLWFFAKKYGHAKTIEEAKAWVEGLAVHFSIPAAQRWMTI